MATLLLCRSALRRNAVPLGIGLSSGMFMVSRQSPMRLDTYSTDRPYHDQMRPIHNGPRRKDGLNPDMVKQLSTGSLSGFAAGLLVSVFSKTLVLLAGIGLVLIQVASRYGIDVVEQFGLKQRVKSSRILAALNHHAAFKLSFGVAFALSAFMSF